MFLIQLLPENQPELRKMGTSLEPPDIAESVDQFKNRCNIPILIYRTYLCISWCEILKLIFFGKKTKNHCLVSYFRLLIKKNNYTMKFKNFEVEYFSSIMMWYRYIKLNNSYFLWYCSIILYYKFLSFRFINFSWPLKRQNIID